MTAEVRVAQLVDGLARVEHVLFSLGRLHAIALLATGKISARPKTAQLINTLFDVGVSIQRFLDDYAGRRPDALTWPTELNPELTGVIREGRVDQGRLSELITYANGACLQTVEFLEEVATSSPMLTPWLIPIGRSMSYFEQGKVRPSGQELAPIDHLRQATPPSKVITGPSSVPLDPLFRPAYSLMDHDDHRFGDTLKQTVPYMWVLASREALAAELAALCLIEWDGMPISFYTDFAKQMWDETRHSDFYLRAAVSLLPALEDELDSDDPLRVDVTDHLVNGTGLPIPIEGNLYEAILNATLIERLVIMHHDTETPGIANLQKQMDSVLWERLPHIAADIGIVQVDERTHARLGRRWLAKLIPDRNERQEAIEFARMLRPLLLLTCFAHHNPKRLEDLVAAELARIEPTAP